MQVRQITNYDCDVLIAGGGPAGSGLAYHLASAGLHVIVVEAEEFPRVKVCGDGVSPIALSELKRMGITEGDNFLQANEIKQVGLFIKNDKVHISLSKPEHLPFHARIIPRLELDKWISDAAKQAGVKYIENSRVTGYHIKSNVAIASCKKGSEIFNLKARMLVGADGASSTISRQLNGAKPSNEFQLLGLRAYYEGVNGPNDRVDIYFTEDSFPGIFWMFPKGEQGANIGMAMVSETLPAKPRQARDLLTQHINNNTDIRERIGNGKMVGKIQGWPIRFYNKKSKLIDHRLLLVGDAAGLINPLSGDGIQYALLSANWASTVIIDCWRQNNFSFESLTGYTSIVKKELGYDFALSNLLVQLPRNNTFSKWWMNVLDILISRAKKDKVYADIIAGIFEGTYPSYKALHASFILKSMKEGGLALSNGLLKNLKSPETVVDTLANSSEGILEILNEMSTYQKEHIGWLKNTAGKTIAVGGQVVKHWIENTK